MIIGNRYFIDNPESGLYEVTKEEYERYNKFMLKAMKHFEPKLSDKIKGIPIIVGTAGDMESGEDFKSIWMSLNQFKDTDNSKGVHAYFIPKYNKDDTRD